MANGKEFKWIFRLGIFSAFIFVAFLAPNFLFAEDFIKGQNPSFISKNKIIFSKKYKGALNLFLFNIKTKKTKHLIRDADYDYVNASGNIFCPKNKKIVFSSDRRGNDEIWSLNLKSLKLRRLTHHPSQDWEPVWGRACEEIIFQSDRDGNWEIYKLRLKDKKLFRLTFHSSRDQQPDWSVFGKIIFQSNRGGNWDIQEMEDDGENLKNLTKSSKEETDAVWSPDGKYFAYSGDGRKSEEIFIREIETNKTYQQTKNNFYDGAPSFSPDGKKIAYEFRISDKLFWRIKKVKLSP